MLYVGIDLHLKQLTVCIRDEEGQITCRRQVSTRPAKVQEFLAELREHQAGFVAILEVCGFHDWLLHLLRQQAGCRDVLAMHPDKRSKRKTDRRDANLLSELLWVNRQRISAGEKVQGIRRVYTPTPREQEDRQLTAMRLRLGRQRTRTLNQIHYVLRRNNLEWERPTKTFQTRACKQWLIKLPRKEIDRLELDMLVEQWDFWDQQLAGIETRLAERCENHEPAQLLRSIVGVSSYMALAISSRIGEIGRFSHGRSLANYLGLTPGSRSSGETERLGSITKEGSRHVRFLLGQLVLHVLRKDGQMRKWYQRIKHRRGAKIARVAVMRRLAVIIWQMLSQRRRYVYGSLPDNPGQLQRTKADSKSSRKERGVRRPTSPPPESTDSSSLCPVSVVSPGESAPCRA